MKAAIVALVLCAATRAHARCHDTTSIIGHSRCHRFGWWGSDHDGTDVTLDTGGFLAFRRVVLDPTLGVTSYGGVGPPVIFHGLRRARYAAGPGMRLGFDVGHLVIGVEESVAHGFSDAGLASDPAGLGTRLTMLDLGVVGGVRTRGWRTELRAELAGGLEVASQTGSCRGDQCLGTDDLRIGLELRVRADRWISRYATLGLAAGASLVTPGELSLALVLIGHDRPYDGW